MSGILTGSAGILRHSDTFVIWYLTALVFIPVFAPHIYDDNENAFLAYTFTRAIQLTSTILTIDAIFLPYHATFDSRYHNSSSNKLKSSVCFTIIFHHVQGPRAFWDRMLQCNRQFQKIFGEDVKRLKVMVIGDVPSWELCPWFMGRNCSIETYTLPMDYEWMKVVRNNVCGMAGFKPKCFNLWN